MKILFYVIFYLLFSALCEKNELFAFEIKDSTLTPSQAVFLNQIRAVGLQTVGAVVVWNQAGDPDDMYNDDGRPVWLECDGSSFDTGYYTALASIIPSGVLPSLNDQFLRGGTSGQVGQTALDTTRSHLHGIPSHSHMVSGSASAQNVSVGGQSVYGTAAGQQYLLDHTWLGSSSTSEPGYDGQGNIPIPISAKDLVTGMMYMGSYSQVKTATPSSVTGVTSSNNFTTSGGSITGITNSVSQNTNYTGEVETAPQHIRVRYLIRALP